MTRDQGRTGDRLKGMAAAALVQAAIGYLLYLGLAVAMPGAGEQGLKLFSVAPPPPPPRVERPKPSRTATPRKEGRASPVNIRSKATEVVAPKPVVPLVVPPPVVAALKAGPGFQTTSGAAPVRGPGTGAGGVGDGYGSGGDGDGDGGGAGETPPIRRRGDLYDSDYAEVAVEAGASGTVSVRYVVETNGRVGDCEITHSSGSRALDDVTCRLIQQRFRFEPSRDARGRPVTSVILENHSWEMQRVAPDPDEEPRRRVRRRLF